MFFQHLKVKLHLFMSRRPNTLHPTIALWQRQGTLSRNTAKNESRASAKFKMLFVLYLEDFLQGSTYRLEYLYQNTAIQNIPTNSLHKNLCCSHSQLYSTTEINQCTIYVDAFLDIIWLNLFIFHVCSFKQIIVWVNR